MRMAKLGKLLSAKWWIGPPPGPVAAVRFRRAVRWQQRVLASFEKADRECRSRGIAPRVECPVCGHRGWAFHPYGGRPLDPVMRYDAVCPGCGAVERHRLMKLALDEAGLESWSGPLLHFAPEPHLAKILQGVGGVDYSTADLYMPGVDHQVDIQNLPFDDGSWAYIVCSHVLEHVPDDERSLAELRRVLRPGGILVLCVPCVPFYEEPRATVTFEPGSPLRSLLGHHRTYGLDFVDRVGKHFDVENRSAEHRPVEEVLRHGLMMWHVVSDMLLVCR